MRPPSHTALHAIGQSKCERESKAMELNFRGARGAMLTRNGPWPRRWLPSPGASRRSSRGLRKPPNTAASTWWMVGFGVRSCAAPVEHHRKRCAYVHYLLTLASKLCDNNCNESLEIQVFVFTHRSIDPLNLDIIVIVQVLTEYPPITMFPKRHWYPIDLSVNIIVDT